MRGVKNALRTAFAVSVLAVGVTAISLFALIDWFTDTRTYTRCNIPGCQVDGHDHRTDRRLDEEGP